MFPSRYFVGKYDVGDLACLGCRPNKRGRGAQRSHSSRAAAIKCGAAYLRKRAVAFDSAATQLELRGRLTDSVPPDAFSIEIAVKRA